MKVGTTTEIRSVDLSGKICTEPEESSGSVDSAKPGPFPEIEAAAVAPFFVVQAAAIADAAVEQVGVAHFDHAPGAFVENGPDPFLYSETATTQWPHPLHEMQTTAVTVNVEGGQNVGKWQDFDRLARLELAVD